MFIRSQTTTLLQIFGELSLCSQVIFKSMKVADVRFWWSSKCEWVNPLLLRVPLENVVYFSHTLECSLGFKRKFTKYLNKSCCLTSNYHYSFKNFPKNAFVSRIFPKLADLLWSI